MQNHADATLRELLAALPEIYQPIIGHPDVPFKRSCADRWDAIRPIAAALRQELGRPLRALDIGCAQGFFSMSLASLGIDVVGIDRDPRNIAVCEFLRGERQESRVSFIAAEMDEWLPKVLGGEFDLILGLSVLHHLAHERGLAVARETIGAWVQGAPVVLVELAEKEEALYWSQALP
ncbi:MAG TPA: methyltransferase domain-containing protein, partial [Casimicrobiaceae bacterium]